MFLVLSKGMDDVAIIVQGITFSFLARNTTKMILFTVDLKSDDDLHF